MKRPFPSSGKGLCPGWRHGESNPGPPACKAGALPIELCPRGDVQLCCTVVNRTEPVSNLVRGLGPEVLLGLLVLELLADSQDAGSSSDHQQELSHGQHSFALLVVRQGDAKAMVVGLRGLEPLTSSLSGKRSNRLSYRPARHLLRALPRSTHRRATHEATPPSWSHPNGSLSRPSA